MSFNARSARSTSERVIVRGGLNSRHDMPVFADFKEMHDGIS